MILIDSSFLISLFATDEERHARSVDLWKGLSEKGLITDHIFEEVVDWLMKHRGPETAYEAGRRMLNNAQLEIIIVDRRKIEIALEIMKKYGGLSLCDSLSVLIMKESGLVKILSFDSDFDRFKGIERLH
ncbi:MAG TPA: PIN domain-containing protein [Candidatus Norongarragalinales archaeon]|nr:PIN domain-containing protein [Candidatus Norongarragalinales archaeon]